ncbi:MAG: peptidoglycan-binding protein, partial [Desulfatitalea sp.]|nr:peptidoglycan-binding protein [Desulfatitalea sp.]
MPIVPRLDPNEDYLQQYLLKDFLELNYLLDHEDKSLQHHLNLLGFACGRVDGIVGPKTRAGIKAFQKQYGLQVDGIAGPITKRTLEQVFYRRHIGVYKDNAYAVPVWKKMSVAWRDLFFETAMPAQVVAKAYALTTDQQAARFDLFVHTKDKSSTPRLIHRETIAEDNKGKDNKPVPYEALEFPKQRNYYDLPVEWSSRNYWTRYGNRMDKGDRYQKVMKDRVKLFPYVTGADKRA